MYDSTCPSPTSNVYPLCDCSKARGIILAKVTKKTLPSAQHHALSCLHIKKQPNLQMNEEDEDEAISERRSEGGNRGVSKAFVHLLRHKTANGTEGPSTVRHAVRCTKCFVFFPLCFMNTEPASPSPPVRSSLSSLIPSNLTTLHGRIIINQVTNRATPFCFRGTALLSSLCGSNVSHLFQALAVRITQGCYNSGLFAL